MPKLVLNRLTDRRIAALNKPGMHCDGSGLYLYVGKGGSKSWVVLFTWGGRRRSMGLGSIRDVPLKDARKAANAARYLAYQLIDPIEERNKKLAKEAA